MKRLMKFTVILAALFSITLHAQEKKEKDPLSAGTVSKLKFRSIGPGFSSGRIADFAVNPRNHSEYYVGVAAGNVWKTTNRGTTWKPIFDKYGAWSIADVEIDPNNPYIVWVGTGEYNSQRAIGYGDGVYRSEDGGKSFKNMGLKESEHIGRIVIDPRNSHVYAAAQGPLWGPGGDRGLYKSEDHGKSWNKILDIGEHTGVTDIVFDPTNPDRLYAASYQRRRHVYTLINGGPESAIYRSTDAGMTWTKCKGGLPSGDVGRIGLALSPADPDRVYAIIEASGSGSGFYRSMNRGVTWQKMSSYISGSPQYYNRICADPKDPDKIYSMDVRSRVSLDGGKTWRALGNSNRHVDDHAIWIDPHDTNHFIIGGDGGIYETWDNTGSWHFKSNLPITQYYRVEVDNSEPFYWVYGGTQDNNSHGGPARTTSSMGIVNDDWIVTRGGDGFESQIDPENPDIIYAQSQYGGLVRYDKKSGESFNIKPQPPGGEAYRWNWNAPLIISPHSATRLYFGANRLFRSDDRGSTWRVISPDLTRQIDRNKLPVMGKVWSVDAVSKNRSTSLFGNLTAISESPLVEDLIYVGTDDGLIQVSEDAGDSWRKIEKFPGIPEMTYVDYILASQHDDDAVYAAFDGRKQNDLAPHLMKSTDRGKSWKSIVSNLPDRGTVYCIAEDHVNPGLLFVGTEFALYFTIDGGQKWIQLKGGLPVTQFRDLAIQRRENDLVAATFGRGFYVLDDYTPLRHLTRELLDDDAHIFPIKQSLMFIRSSGKGSQGQSYFTAPNPPVGAVFTYYLKESIKTKQQLRREAEKNIEKKGEDIPYPSWDELRAEDDEEKPYLLFTVSDTEGNVIRRLKTSASAGINRLVWDFRYPDFSPVRSASDGFNNNDGGILALPGDYTVTMGKVTNGRYTVLVGPQPFKAVVLDNTTLPADDRESLVAFHKKVAELSRAVQGAGRLANDLDARIDLIRQALHKTPDASETLVSKAKAMKDDITEIRRALSGDWTVSRRYGNQPPSISSRVRTIVSSQWRSTSAPSQTMKDQYRIAGEAFEPLLSGLKRLVEFELKNLESAMDSIGAPWTPWRIPDWQIE